MTWYILFNFIDILKLNIDAFCWQVPSLSVSSSSGWYQAHSILAFRRRAVELIKKHLEDCLNINEFQIMLYIQHCGELLPPLALGIDGIWAPCTYENVFGEDLHLIYRKTSTVNASNILEISLFAPNSQLPEKDANIEAVLSNRTIFSATVYALRNFFLEKGVPFISERDIGNHTDARKVYTF